MVVSFITTVYYFSKCYFTLSLLTPPLQAGAAVPVGFCLFVVAWVFLIVIGFGFPYSAKYSPIARAVFNAFPWTLLAKGVGDLAAASDGRFEGLRWADRQNYCQVDTPPPYVQEQLSYWQINCVTPLSEIYLILRVQTAIFIILAVWIDRLQEARSLLPVWSWKVSN